MATEIEKLTQEIQKLKAQVNEQGDNDAKNKHVLSDKNKDFVDGSVGFVREWLLITGYLFAFVFGVFNGIFFTVWLTGYVSEY